MTRVTKVPMATTREKRDIMIKKATKDIIPIMVVTRNPVITVMVTMENTTPEKKVKRATNSAKKDISRKDTAPKEDTVYIN